MNKKIKSLIIIALILLSAITVILIIIGFGKYKNKSYDGQLFEKQINQTELKSMIIGIKKGELFTPNVGKEYAQYEMAINYDKKMYIAKCVLNEDNTDINVHFMQEISELDNGYKASAIFLGLITDKDYEYIGREYKEIVKDVLSFSNDVFKIDDVQYTVNQVNEKRKGYKYTIIESHKSTEEEIKKVSQKKGE